VIEEFDPPTIWPPGSVDCHAHVFDKALRWTAPRRYAPNYNATLDHYIEQLDANRIDYGVLVQPSFLGTDNAYLLRALAREPRRLKGVAVLPPEVTDIELHRLHAQGVTGLRLNLVDVPIPNLRSAPWAALWPRLSLLGWHVELHCAARHLASLIEPLLEAGLAVAVDHFGRPDPAQGVDDPGFESLLRFGASRRVWVKVSAAYRCTQSPSSFVRVALHTLLASFGSDRLMWGSDWPHTQFEPTTSYDDALAIVGQAGLDTATLEALMRSTANAFYGFDSSSHHPAALLPTPPRSDATSPLDEET
jgi:predicted TIM-barrel fold metal-dependent hydrolase